jgi:putative membrane protein
MRTITKRISRSLILAGLVAAPAFAVSLSTNGPVQSPQADAAATSIPLAENLAAGSATLVPAMAADIPADISTVEASNNTSGGVVGKPIDDAAFVARATESGNKELGSARNALPQLKDLALKRIAEMLVNDHGDANARLAKLADEKGWPVPEAARPPDPPAGAATGDFDARWTAEMIAGHERSVALYRAQAQGGDDKDLRKYARETLPTIERHLAELRRLQK